MKPSLYSFILYLFTIPVFSQVTDIKVPNAGFEQHSSKYETADHWIKCHNGYRTRPRLISNSNQRHNINKFAWEGKSFIGLTTQDDGSRQIMSVELAREMKANTCYEMTVWLAKSSVYDYYDHALSSGVDHTHPVRLKIYGGDRVCRPTESLASSPVVEHESWTAYTFYFKPTQKISVLSFRADYESGYNPYNGHILLDDISMIEKINCDYVPEDGFTYFNFDLNKKSVAMPMVRQDTEWRAQQPKPNNNKNTGSPWRSEKNIYSYLQSKNLPVFKLVVTASDNIDYYQLLQDKYGKEIICFVLTSHSKKTISELREVVMQKMKRYDYPSWAFTMERDLQKY